MSLSNKAKHKLTVTLVSDYLMTLKYEHLVFSSDPSFDIYIPSSESRIKIFCNYSNSKGIRVPGNFEFEMGVLYLVVKPTRNNVHGFSVVGGDRSVLEKSITILDIKGSPKNIHTTLLKSVSVKKHIENDRTVVDKKGVDQSGFKYILSKYKENIMPYNVQLTDKCKELLLDDYEEHREYGEANTPVEDEMIRHSLEIAVKEGWVKSFSKKEMTKMVA